ncbi:aldehyde dehydrogenase family protein [Allofranklinella schreckenbergeri]|uniref:4-(hydroxymethyl)benzenesulfonate dehydrogenase n=1 Tax=Allofranklinella schreckenbergeri TaxID=1076744 RepID=A0A3M6Q1E4_9BURK|nr:aldehyde dehydrogenase family protein [Allofranklinella schreckenbergeri]RMW96281.1 aldehyde dehydrogenase family protein [Allofranklinella schreckenbergeri]
MAQVELLAAVQAFLARTHGSFIEGKAVATARTLPVYNPATGDVIAMAGDGDADVVDAAVRSAHTAWRDGRWSGLRPAERERILLAFAALVQAHAEELAQLETINQGKSINLSRMLDVAATVEFMRYMAGWATKLHGESLDLSIPIPPGMRYTGYTRREPVGVVAGIVPWNFPMMIAAWKVMPALAAGCSVVIKPSPETPLSALRLAELALEAGVPPGVFNVVTGGGETGQALVSHPLVAKVSFTGSTQTGRRVGHAALEHMARFTLELGGKNPMLVFADADIEQAVQGVMLGGLLNQGQVCAAASRIYVHASRHDDFVNALAAAVSTLTLGPGLDPGAQVNPVVSRRQQQSIESYIASARQEGAQLAAGGQPVGGAGFFVQPTVLSGVSQAMTVAREEIFGPVLSVLRFDDDEEALRLANDSQYGLGASLWTRDINRAMSLIPRVEAGTVWVNTHVLLDPSMPFGGYKQSGMGREFGRHAVEGCTEIKSVCIAHPASGAAAP